MANVKARKTPSMSLARALEMLRDVQRSVGYGPASRETVLEALGHQSLSGTASRKIAVLTHYDLMDRSKKKYQISDLGRRILMPQDDPEYRGALVEAAKSPQFYQDIWEAFGGEALPSMLPNILVRQFGVHPSSSEEVVDIFRETAEFAGLLRHGVLYQTPPADEESKPEDPDEEVDEGDEGDAEIGGHADETLRTRGSIGGGRNTQVYSIPLDHEGRVARVELPLPVSSTDLESLVSWAEYMKGLHKNKPGVSGN